MIVGKTKAGTSIGYRVKEGDALHSVYFVGGGEVPDKLKGLWTDARQVTNAIITYLSKDKLCAPDQAKKTLKKNLRAAKNRKNTLRHPEKKDA